MPSFMDLPPELRQKCFLDVSLLTKRDDTNLTIYTLPYFYFEHPLPLPLFLINNQTSAEALRLVFTSLLTINLGMPMQPHSQLHEPRLRSLLHHPQLATITKVRIQLIINMPHSGHLRRTAFLPGRSEWQLLPTLLDVSRPRTISVVACSGHNMRFNRGGPGLGLHSEDVLHEVLRQLGRADASFDVAYAAGLNGVAREPLAEREDDLVMAIMKRVEYAKLNAVTP